ncbi:MAG: DNA mismatch repair endonuclease MutL [Firmicutes bacterium]|nr:DNA mismatch repair endonuclease MutL [Bacillota bacterium]
MGKIIRLDEVTINQIAAGEVVERPSSGVKELVENALDAGAKKIEIYLTNGGRQKIQVVDDGVGMDREDALLAVERHATSKIREFQDLQNSSTLGFRGEALASIAAVSRLTLQTAVDPAAPGTKIRVEGGEIQAVETVGAPRGTNISVENLFFNTPARLKFMRSIPAEVANVKEIVTSLALGYPEVSFRLLHQEMKLVHTMGTGDYEQTLEQIFSPAICRELFPVAGDYGPLRITGFLGRPTIARGNRGQQYFFLNRRFFRSRLVAAAAERAYDTLLPVARFPFLLLNLELPPELVDINVHPTKMEVKFRDEKEVFRGIIHIIRGALEANVTATSWRPQYRPTTVPDREQPAAAGLFEAKVEEAAAQVESTQASPFFATVRESAVPFSAGGPAPAPPTEEWLAETVTAQEEGSPRIFPLFDTYLLWEDATALVLVDQHAAHERILYDRLRSGSTVKMQYFLAPLTVELSPAQLQIIHEEGDLLRDIGWEFEAFGGEAIILRAGPLDFSVAEVEDLFLSLLNELGATGEARQVDPKERLLRLMACRQAVKAGDRLSAQEAAALIRDLRRTKVPQTCPHGRPTMVAITKTELEKMFKRR